MQTSVTDEPIEAYEGMVATGIQYPTTVDSFIAGGSIYFGKAVAIYSDAEMTAGIQRVKLPDSGNEQAATKACSAATYALLNGDTFVMDVNNVGDATTTYNDTTSTILDTSVYTGGTAADITDTTVYTGGTAATITDTSVYPHADQVGLTLTVTVTDAINGAVPTVVTFTTTTTALEVAADINDQVVGVNAVVAGGQVVITTDAVGLDVAITAVVGTSALTFGAPVAGTGGLANQEGLTAVVTVTDAINGAVGTTVTFTATSGFVTELSQVVDQINDQVAGVTAEGSTGQVIISTDDVGLDVAIAVGAGTGGLTWAAATAGTLGLANQEGLTALITLTGGPYTTVVQTVTFTATSGFVTRVSQIVAQMGAQLDGCAVSESAGQVLVTHDGFGSIMDITFGAGTGGLTFAASTAGTGDALDGSAVTAAELEILIEGDTTATVAVVGLIPTISSPTLGAGSELDFKSGTLLAKLGLSVEVITAPAAGALAPTNMMGVAMADTSLEATDNDYGEFFLYDQVPVLKKGRIWVVSADAVDDISKGVYIRHANGSATPPTGTLGSFRATANADYTLMADGVKWKAGKTIGGVEYGLLELNLVP